MTFLLQALQVGSSLSPEGHPILRPATCHALNLLPTQTAHSHTDINSVLPTTALSTTPTEAVNLHPGPQYDCLF